jgi:hypothetical protein
LQTDQQRRNAERQNRQSKRYTELKIHLFTSATSCLDLQLRLDPHVLGEDRPVNMDGIRR